MKTAAGADALAMGRLQSLRRAADNIGPDYQADSRSLLHTFIDQNAGTPAADAAAKADVKIWQDRLDHGMVKVGDKWMTTDERDELRAKSTDLAIAPSRHDQTGPAQAIDADPRPPASD